MRTPADTKKNTPIPVRKSLPTGKNPIIDFTDYPMDARHIREILYMIKLILCNGKRYLLTVKIKEDNHADGD